MNQISKREPAQPAIINREMKAVCRLKTEQERRDAIAPFVQKLLEKDDVYPWLGEREREAVKTHATNIAASLVEQHIEIKLEFQKILMAKLIPEQIYNSNKPDWAKKTVTAGFYGIIGTLGLAVMFTGNGPALLTGTALLKAVGIEMVVFAAYLGIKTAWNKSERKTLSRMIEGSVYDQMENIKISGVEALKKLAAEAQPTNILRMLTQIVDGTKN